MSTPTLPPSPRLFLVDGYALIYRAFFALISRPLRTSRGENTSAAWGIVNFLNRLVATHKPDYLGWVHDSGLSFRHERYPEYKATREKLTDELQDDFDRGMERICAILDAWRIPILTLKGYEADDVIGSLAQKGVDAGLNVVVVSGDKDFHQLVRPGVWLLNPGRGGPAAVDESWVGVENGSERLGVPPERTVDYLALVGDTSDNVPGVKGIGDKGAQALIQEFGALEEILANVANIKAKRPREALQAHAADAILSKELVTIRCDLDVAFDVDTLRMGEPDRDALKQLYMELEFTSLARDVAALPSPAGGAPDTSFDFGANVAPKPSQPAAEYETVDTVQKLQRLLARARKAAQGGGMVAVDTETVIDPDSPSKVDPLRSRLVGIAMAIEPGEAFYLPLAHRAYEPAQAELGFDEQPAADPNVEHADGDDEEAAPKKKAKAAKPKGPTEAAQAAMGIAGRMLAERRYPVKNLPPLDAPEMRELVALLEDPAVPKVLQNAKYDLLALRRAGIALGGVAFDTMLASYVLDPGRRSHGLDVLALEILDHRMTSYDELCGRGRQQLPFDVVPIEAATRYSAEDADMTLRLQRHFAPLLEETGLMPLFRDIEVPLVCVLADMESAGIAIDVEHFRSLKTRFQAERERLEREIYVEAGEEFNINSNPQLRAILFEKLGLPVKKKTATGPSTDASVLTELADEGYAIPQLLMEYRELFKLEGTYLDALPAAVNPETGRIHTSFAQTVAATGRLSSSDPNLQNIPIRRELGRDIRRGFVPRKGWRLLAADYSQIELRLLAHLSQDPAFVAAFRRGGDIHRETAAIIFGVPVEQVTKEMRARAKTINFATIYGQGAHALSRQLKIANAEARAFIETYFERFRGVKDYLEGQVEYARAHGYVETIFKRRRYIPELKERNFNIRAFGERVAQNAPIQGSAADLIKIAMIRIGEALRAPDVGARMLLQVHDELVFEVPGPELAATEALVRREMEGAAALSVPLVVDVGVGDDWLETKG
ncbi:DNA polymerase I [Roseisolibacter sp. H3M3-2]|uniref:DNA polymerase I n=1 Tax=Roseisolibacter sp. H3M3-2 TaxID=3031323 RepID=UPI0023D97C7F|nr:DNA polymerase I [Roseisolibacter sp. H3M3-2]MDF1504150.1 DNA polymerase I [Roseisolibacter sp. H3M3-2]